VQCTLDSFVDFSAMYIACLASPLTSFFLHLFFLIYLFPYLPFPLRIDPLCFWAGGRKRRQNLGLLYIFVVLSPGFDFVFSVLVKRLAGKSISKMTSVVSSRM